MRRRGHHAIISIVYSYHIILLKRKSNGEAPNCADASHTGSVLIKHLAKVNCTDVAYLRVMTTDDNKFALSKMTNKLKAARVGAKFTPPTLGIEYNTGNGDEKKALKVNITDLINANPGNPSAILAKLTAMHPDIINEDVVSMPQILRLVTILVEKLLR